LGCDPKVCGCIFKQTSSWKNLRESFFKCSDFWISLTQIEFPDQKIEVQIDQLLNSISKFSKRKIPNSMNHARNPSSLPQHTPTMIPHQLQTGKNTQI
jgi:hypothetical protein